MKANNIGQVSTSTGTGNFTLGSVWNNCETFFSWFGLNHRFEYLIRHEDGTYEKGLGYLSNSTTLVRELVIDSHLHIGSLVDFAAGNKVVMCSTDVGSGIVPICRPDGVITSLHSLSAAATTVSLTANNPRLVPFWLHRPLQTSAIGIEVTGAGTSSNILLALYQLTVANSVSGYSFSLMEQIGSVASNTTGFKEISYTRKLGVGTYFIYTASTVTCTVRANPASTGEIGLSVLNGTTGANFFSFGTVTNSGTTAPGSLTLAAPTGNSTSPKAFFKGAWL